MDVCSVHHGDVFLRYSVSLLGYGFYGDVLTDSERKRWLGPARYDLSGMTPPSFSKAEPARLTRGSPATRLPNLTPLMLMPANLGFTPALWLQDSED